MRLLDADVLIDVLRGYAPAGRWLASVSAEEIGLPGLVVMELIAGRENLREARQIERLVKPYPIYWPTEQDCRRALDSFARHHLRHSLGLVDALIGACAVGLNVPLVTFNVRHFRAMPNLVTEQPYGRV